MNEKVSQFYTYIFLGFFQLLCCNQITGWLTLLFILLSNSDYKVGQIKKSETNKRNAKIVTFIGIVSGLIIYMFYMLFIIGIMQQ